jgi:phage tail sheath protein FI
MAETLISPGVLARENDRSQITAGPVTFGAAIIGPTVKGPVEIPTLVTSYSEYQNKFGTTFTSGSQVYTYFTSIAAYNYFNNGGTSLLVARVKSGSFTSATSSAISGSTLLTTQPTLVLKTISQGTIMNSTGPTGSNGTLLSGSSDNIRWQITNNNTSSGTFDLLIRQGNDSATEPIILETWAGLSMDPLAPNFVSRVLGDTNFTYDANENYIKQNGTYPNQSKYVYVSAVNSPTPYYFDNNGTAKSEFTASIPINASGTFGSATGTIDGAGGFLYYQNISGELSPSDINKIQGIPSASYDDMINLFANQDDYKFNILLTPGLYNKYQPSQVTNIISNTQNRGDSIYVVDAVGYGSTINTVTNQANSRNTSYAATYWPWIQTIDPDSGQEVWVPASTLIGGVYAYNDSIAEPWFAPAGINRGGLGTVIRAERKLSQTNRDALYTSKVNPIATFPGTGVVVYGQKTLQTKASALDRVNVRRLLIDLKSYISQIALNLVFEQNTIATRNQFLSQVNPYLESVQQRQGLYAFKVVMDDSNNTPDVVDRNQLVGAIYLQPTKTAEFIYLDFNITPTGATFPA